MYVIKLQSFSNLCSREYVCLCASVCVQAKETLKIPSNLKDMQEDESLRKTSVMIFQRSSEDMDVNDGKRRSDGGCKGEGL